MEIEMMIKVKVEISTKTFNEVKTFVKSSSAVERMSFDWFLLLHSADFITLACNSKHTHSHGPHLPL